ncbi:MAG: tripartite tricarboxylate transporter TctB family protein [Devosia sp.]
MTDLRPSVDSKRRPQPAALAIAVVLVAIAALIVFDMQRITTAGAYARVGPTMLPYVMAGCLLVLAIAVVVQAVRGKFPVAEPQEIRPVAIICAGLLAQLVLLPFAGFIVATSVLFVIVAYGFGERRIHLTAPFALVFTTIVWVVFARFLRLTLPAGPIERFLIEMIASTTGLR